MTVPATNGTHETSDGAPEDRLRVVIADADPQARRVVREMCEDGGGFIVAAEARDGVEAVELGLLYRPDVVLMELALPRIDGVEATRRIKAQAPEVNVLMFSVGHEIDVQLGALRAGASGFLSKHTQLRAVAQAIRGVARGEAAISRSLTLQLIERLRLTSVNSSGMRPVKSDLTSREWEVLDLMSDGATTGDIAAQLFLSEDTVYSHIKSILKKLGVHSRADAVAAAARIRDPGLA